MTCRDTSSFPRSAWERHCGRSASLRYGWGEEAAERPGTIPTQSVGTRGWRGLARLSRP
jgi:hypothetical protein